MFGQLKDWVAHDLARPMKGHISASGNRDNGNRGWIENIVGRPTGSSDGVNRVVFADQEGVTHSTADALVQHRFHGLDGILVGDLTEIYNPQPSLSRVADTSATTR